MLMKCLLLFALIIVSSESLRNTVKKINPDYTIPKWARRRFKSNRIPRFSKYHHKNRNMELFEVNQCAIQYNVTI